LYLFSATQIHIAALSVAAYLLMTLDAFIGTELFADVSCNNEARGSQIYVIH
jgi:uncharacterized membrane protein